MNRDCDTVVIGSGIGGLTAALCHAQAGDKVIVTEQHYVPGGWCHSFTMEGNHFDTGVHYIGELYEGGLLRNIFEGLGVGGDLSFCEMNRAGYEHVFIDGKRYDYPVGTEAFKNYLIKLFPHEETGIRGLLDKTAKFTAELPALLKAENLMDIMKLPFVAPATIRWTFSSYDRFMRRYLKDERLMQLLSAQAGDHAMPPNEITATMHVEIMEHYLRGSFYPQGGGHRLARAFVRALKRHKGEVLLRTKVEAILTQGHGRSRKAVGVRLANGDEIRCNKVISNADPHLTFTEMLEPETLSKRLRRRLSKTSYSPSCLFLFLATDIDLKARGFDSGNYWYYNKPDVNEVYRICRDERLWNEREFPFFAMAMPTLKDPSRKSRHRHTLEALTYLPYNVFEKWRHSTLGDRPDGYVEFKERLKERFLDNIEKLIPDIRQDIKFCELGTPLTSEFYNDATEGNMFGTEKSAFQSYPFSFPMTTEIRNLYMCGASTLGHGIAGALFSGIAVSRISLKCSVNDLLRFKDKEITVYQSEDINTWPSRYHGTIAEKWRKHDVPQWPDVQAENVELDTTDDLIDHVAQEPL